MIRSTVLAATLGAFVTASAFAAETGQPLLDLPKAVKDAIRREAGEQMVSSIQLESHDGKQVYECTIAQEGFDRTVSVDTDGAVVSQSDWNKRVDEGKIRAHDAWEKTKLATKQAWEAAKEKVGGATDHGHLTLTDLPAPVRTTIEREAGGNEIKDIDHEMKNGQHFYDAEVKISEGQNKKIKVSEDGAVVERH